MDQATVEIINKALDMAGKETGLKKSKLAESFGVARSTIWRWRQGDVGEAASILIPLILKIGVAPEEQNS